MTTGSRPLVLAITALLASGASACDGCSRGSGGAAEVDASTPPSPGRVMTDPDAAPINATVISAAEIASAVNPQKLPAYTGPTGSVEGTITVIGDPAPSTHGIATFTKCPDAAKTWGHAFREGSPSGPKGARPLADAIVAVTGYAGYFLPETKEAKPITIEGCGFTTRTLTMTYGQRIEAKNDTNEFWTPILEPGANLVMMMAAPHGDPVKIYPKKPGHYILRDRDRAYTEVDVYAFLHPLHAASDTKGYYRIDDVPVGKLKVNTTHPRFHGEASADVEIKPNVVQRVDLTLEFRADEGGTKTYDAGRNYPALH